MNTPTITTLTDGRLRLRRLDPTDVDVLFEGVRASIPALSMWMPWATEEYSREYACRFVCTTWLNWARGVAFEFLIEDAETGRFLGMCGLNGVDPTDGRANLGYWVRTDAAGQGVCTAAARLVARFGFEHLGLRRIRLFHAVGNHGSRRVAEKVGFVLEATQRKRTLLRGEMRDVKLYSLVDVGEIR